MISNQNKNEFNGTNPNNWKIIYRVRSCNRHIYLFDAYITARECAPFFFLIEIQHFPITKSVAKCIKIMNSRSFAFRFFGLLFCRVFFFLSDKFISICALYFKYMHICIFLVRFLLNSAQTKKPWNVNYYWKLLSGNLKFNWAMKAVERIQWRCDHLHLEIGHVSIESLI